MGIAEQRRRQGRGDVADGSTSPAVSSRLLSAPVAPDGDAGVVEVVVVDLARHAQFQEQGRANAGEAMPLARNHGQDFALAHLARHTVKSHVHTPLDEEERFVLEAMAMGGTGLSVEHEQIFSAVSSPGLVGDPVLDEPGPGKIAQAMAASQFNLQAMRFFNLIGRRGEKYQIKSRSI